jgi:hypothetical protein
VYKRCALGNNANASFPSNKGRSKGILDIIHLDVSGMMLIESVQGSSYNVMFIDEFYTKSWIIFMKTRDAFFSCFRGLNIEWKTRRKITSKS